MTTLLTSARIGRPSSLPQSDVTDAERIAFGTRELDFVLNPSAVAQEFFGLTLRDQVRGTPILVTGGTLSELNGNPALDFPDAGYCAAAYTVPPSYFIAAVTNMDTVANSFAIVSSKTASDNRLYFGGGASNLRLDHGLDAGNSVTFAVSALTGVHLLWASYDAVSGAAEIGLDAITPVASSTFLSPHKASTLTYFYGSATSPMWVMDGRAQTLLIADRYLGGAENALVREALLAWPAYQAGVTLGL